MRKADGARVTSLDEKINIGSSTAKIGVGGGKKWPLALDLYCIKNGPAFYSRRCEHENIMIGIQGLDSPKFLLIASDGKALPFRYCTIGIAICIRLGVLKNTVLVE